MEKKIKILAISHSFIKKINTEMYTVLKNRYNLDVVLICPQYHIEREKKIYPDFNAKEIETDILYESTLFNHLRFKIYKNLINIIKKEKINHVFLDMDILSLQSLILILYSYFINFKICYFSNENNIVEENNYLKKTFKIFFLKIINFFFKTKIKKIFCYTKQIKKNLDYCGFIKTTKIVPLGFDNKKFNRYSKLKNNSKFVISYFGKIESKKGVHTLLKALNLLKFNNWVFNLDLFEVSDLSYYKSIKPDLIDLKKKNRLNLIKCDHNNINEFMKQTDLTIVPSEWNEQYGRVIQEAAACGSIVIGSNIGAIPEILMNEEFIFEEKNILSLKKKIENIYFDYRNFRIKFNEIEKNINLNRSIDTQAKMISEIFIN
jgi:glycosyltransferase involved in cell wall biosynthesis